MIHPIWLYGKSDIYIQDDLLGMIQQLKKLDHSGQYQSVFESFITAIKKEIDSRPVLGAHK